LTWHHTTSPSTTAMSITTAFLFSLLGLAVSRPHTDLMDHVEGSGMLESEVGSGGQPRLDLVDLESEDEGSGLQPALMEHFKDMNEVEMGSAEFRMAELGDNLEGSGQLMSEHAVIMHINEEESGSAEFRMGELLEASGEAGDDLYKSFEEVYELGSGTNELRSVEVGSGMMEASEVEAKVVDVEMMMENIEQSDDNDNETETEKPRVDAEKEDTSKAETENTMSQSEMSKESTISDMALTKKEDPASDDDHDGVDDDDDDDDDDDVEKDDDDDDDDDEEDGDNESRKIVTKET